MGPGGFFPTNPDLADILGDTDFDFLYFWDFLGFQIPRFPGSRFPDAAACGRTLRSQPDPSPNAPMDQIRRKGPCCDFSVLRFLWIQNFQISRSQISKFPEIWPGPGLGLGPGWAPRLGRAGPLGGGPLGWAGDPSGGLGVPRGKC